MHIESTLSSDILAQAINSANDGIVITDFKQNDNPIVFVNSAFERLTGYSKEEILNKNCRFLQGQDRNQRGLEVVREAIQKGTSCRVEIRNYKKDGTLFWNELSIAPMINEKGEITHFVGVQKDITRNKQFEEMMFSKINEDPLTKLYNRRGFFLESRRSILFANKNKINVSLILIDINDFKKINDCYGHSNGDLALIYLANLLKKNHHQADVISRFGGDEFIVLLMERHSTDYQNWITCMNMNLDQLNQSKVIPFSLSVSIGRSTLSFLEKKSIQKAIEEADFLMYYDKKIKKNPNKEVIA